MPAFRDVSFQVPESAITLLLGPSGSGKSSLLLAIAGLIPEALEGTLSGTIALDDAPVTHQAPEDRAAYLGIVFQDPEQQFVTLRVDAEIAFGPENLALPAEEIDQRVDSAVSTTGIEHLRGRRLAGLSGGEQQRVAIASVLATGPRFLLLDEPTANLDPASAHEVTATVASLRDCSGCGVLIVEHRLDELMPAIDHIVVLDQSGTVAFAGPAEGVLTTVLDSAMADVLQLPQVVRLVHALDPDHTIPRARATVADVVRLALDINRLDTPATAPPTSAGSPRMQARDLVVLRDETAVLKGIDLDIRAGELLAVVGPNGAGKSTLLLALAALLPLAEGMVTIDGVDARTLKRRDLLRELGLVFQNPEHQFVTFGVSDELAYGPRHRGDDADEIARIVAIELERFGLAHLAAESPYLLSQGQKRRLSVAAMLVDGQEVLLLDEPTYGQDAETGAEILTLMRALANEGTAVVMVTHDMGAVAAYADRVVTLCEGRIIFDGSPAALFTADDIVGTARLDLPPVVRASLGMREHEPAFPICTSVRAFIAACTGGGGAVGTVG